MRVAAGKTDDPNKRQQRDGYMITPPYCGVEVEQGQQSKNRTGHSIAA